MRKSYHKSGINQKYLKEKNKWIRLTIMATGIPVFFSILFGFFTTNNIFQLVGNGDIILSIFALLLSMIINIFEEKIGDDEQLSNVNMFCIIVLFVQLSVYFGIKAVQNNLSARQYPHKWFFWIIKRESDYYIIFTVFTFVLIIITIGTCIYSIKAIYNHKEMHSNIESISKVSNTRKSQGNNSVKQ